MPERLSVIVSQGQSNHPQKRAVEEAVVTGLLAKPGIDVTVVPYLYDLAPNGSDMLCLTGITGDMVVCSWLFPRATHWILDRNGVRGQVGKTRIPVFGRDEFDEDQAIDVEIDDKLRVASRRDVPSRTIYCLDLRTHDTAKPYLEEIERIAQETAVEIVGLAVAINGSLMTTRADNGATIEADPATLAKQQKSDEAATRRWYPVIDFSRCTNCLECIDFCLFGVYGIDGTDTILVEQPDNCRKGCPACSRVCPENAILFPQHKTATIAGSSEIEGPGKIDLSALFGAPNPGTPEADQVLDTAVRERDEQLLAAGRETVGARTGVPQQSISRQPTEQNPSDASKDELDALIDQLDALDW